MKIKPELRDIFVWLGVGAAALGLVSVMPAQETTSTTERIAPNRTAVVPPFVRFGGSAANRAGDTVEATFRIYAEAEGGEALWSETQQVAVGKDGGYSVLLGLATEGGVPASIFAAGAGRWLGVSLERAPENGRTPLVSVAYALKAADADSVGGIPAATLVTQRQLASQLASVARPLAAQASALGGPVPQTSPGGTGTVNTVPLWTSASTLASSILSQSGTGATAMIGVNVTPTATLDVNGATLLRDNVSLSTEGSASVLAGVNSPLLTLEGASTRRIGSLHQSIPQAFAWQLIPVGNNTIEPSSTLSLLYGSSAQTAVPTGLSILPTGVIDFVSNQTFPGTVTPGAANTFTALQSFAGGLSAGSLSIQPGGLISFAPSQSFPGTITSIAPGFGLTGASVTNGVATLSVDKTVVATLGASSSFKAPQNFAGGLSASGSSTFTNPAGTALTVTNGQSTGIALVANGFTAITGNGTGIGVYGNASSANGEGVVGAAQGSSGTGVYGYAPKGTGVAAIGATGVNATATSLGVKAIATGASSTGVQAQGTAYAVNATGSGASSIAVRAIGGTGVEAQGNMLGISGNAASTNGIGVAGTSTANAGIGLRGIGHLPSATGAGAGGGGVSGSIGIWADSDMPGNRSGFNNAAFQATADDNTTAYIINDSSFWNTETVWNYGGGPTSNDAVKAAPVFRASGPTGDCLLNGAGESICTGAHKTAVPVNGGSRTVAMYAMHAAENWFEDFGTVQLINGMALVKIDPVFAETINGQADYHVFLTPRGDCRGLYVTRLTSTSFEVHELQGGRSTLDFDYRITARRAGHETERMADETEEMRRDPRLDKAIQAARKAQWEHAN